MITIIIFAVFAVNVNCQNFDANFVGVAFSPYTKHWEGNNIPYWNSYSVDDIKHMLNTIGTKFNKIATYGMGVANYNLNNRWDQTDSNCLVARAAATINKERRRLAFHVSKGIHQNGDKNVLNKEISNAFEAARDANAIFPGTVWGLTFTNEYFNDESSGNEILSMIRNNKQRALQLGLKVGTRIHRCDFITQRGSAMYNILANIIRESDFIMCNLYPSQNDVNGPTQRAVDSVGGAYLAFEKEIRKVKPGITVIIGETGWPSQGVSFNKSPNSVSKLKEFWTLMGRWASSHKVQVYMFEAIDEPWKSNKKSNDVNSPSGPNGAEGHYGWWKREGNNYVEK